jgi:hypothetical protein
MFIEYAYLAAVVSEGVTSYSHVAKNSYVIYVEDVNINKVERKRVKNFTHVLTAVLFSRSLRTTKTSRTIHSGI